ncbi:MAG: NAD-dependent epimerase/dehydratase family protein, partial [Armatimonadetes bacterium]|nr:NAD-dependent epimerase/dehydratase family protein [Armatimonadota bacterium]
NIIGALNLLEQCRRYDVRHVLFASTGGAIYGDPQYLPIDERHPVHPISHYGAAKFAVETYLYLYRYNFGLDYTILRYGNVYGPRQDPLGEAGVISIFVNRMLKGETPTVFGSGEQTRDYVFVGDVVRMSMMCGDRTAGEIINVGTGIQTSVNALLAHLKNITNFPNDAMSAPPRAGELAASVLNASKAKELVGWEPQVSLVEGLTRTVEHIRNAV